jgi:hypothetical protein
MIDMGELCVLVASCHERSLSQQGSAGPGNSYR